MIEPERAALSTFSTMDSQPRKTRHHSSRIRRGLAAVGIATGLTTIAVGVVRKNYAGVEWAQNDDGTRLLKLRFPDTHTDVPGTTTPQLDTSDRTGMAVIFQAAMRVEQPCDESNVIRNQSNGHTYTFCLDPQTLRMSADAPYVPFIDIIPVQTDTLPTGDAPSQGFVYQVYAGNKDVCTVGKDALQAAFKSIVSHASGFDQSSIPEPHIVLDPNVEAMSPDLSCSDLCLPVLTCSPGSGTTTSKLDQQHG